MTGDNLTLISPSKTCHAVMEEIVQKVGDNTEMFETKMV